MWWQVAAGVVAGLLLVFPLDLVPDLLPVVGYADDAVTE